ncbi:MAG: hypothetical protein WAT65_05085 [Candidatus Nanopelagicales bacterium]
MTTVAPDGGPGTPAAALAEAELLDDESLEQPAIASKPAPSATAATVVRRFRRFVYMAFLQL